MRDKQALTTGEVAKYCGVNFRTVIRWIERGHLDAYKLPGRGDNRIPVNSFINFLQDNNMPVPEDLALGGRTLVLLAQDGDPTAEIASFVRRVGWEPLITTDPIQFGFLLAQHQPGAVAVSSAAQAVSVSRLIRDADREVLTVMLSGSGQNAGAPEGWYAYQWPADQAALSDALSGDAAA
ncbi:MAG: response regulator [Oceanospirillaceae bacterium]|uniref:helix-turn-helix domain-containing protein n=1 Tax=unclassified Thalassolituus TaxID=2624967 RepID=UPI000C0AE1E9|nr:MULTISPECIES: helix-turn-helix domain-containing protein [unclassified Thalassolituus]MAK92125.1 response regulator [Thalassolituus sp.]MAS24204.1 response regulator [Oceanospirillaceae bacterium]MAX97864.1 response regulator [Oceanospirillaceae bacterium]MBL36694.1 response regulator [Oceanospirillaceae bacterium]MBS54790.1 response regulator [Oceanospirillaceae bacterium]